jgi:lysophospholipase L1-like esterase
MLKDLLRRASMVILLAAASTALAGSPWSLADNVRYLSMGDSFAAGKGAFPVTQGYAYLLYQGSVFAPITNTTFANSAVGGTDSSDVLLYQLPQVKKFKPQIVTMSVGGNDLQKILMGADPTAVIGQYLANMGQILCGLRTTMLSQGVADPLIIVGNQPDYPWLTAQNPQVRALIVTLNQGLAGVAQSCGARVADVFAAFDGREELYLYYRPGASPNEPHPTNAGHRVLAKVYEDAANQ